MLDEVRRDKKLKALLLGYTFASLAHFLHNAEFLDRYPNMPDWLSSAQVYGAWLAIAAIGLAGYVLYRHGARNLGLIAITVYGLLGLSGLTHYWLAPIGAHSFHMNSTILLEAIAGVILSLNAASMLSNVRPPAPKDPIRPSLSE